MHEFSLYSQIPLSRHDQVLQILAGVTAMQPVPICEQTLIYQQLRRDDAAASSKKKQQQQPSGAQTPGPQYRKLIREIGNEEGPWRLRAEDAPQAGVQHMTSRAVTEALIGDADLERFREGGTWNRYIDQFLFTGHRFIQNNLIIRVARVLAAPEGTGALEPLDAPTPVMQDCKCVDPSGSYFFEVSVRVADGTNSKLTDAAKKELLDFKALVEGSIDLKVPNRLSMDTRVKGAS